MTLLLAANIGVPAICLLSDIAFGKENFNPFHQSNIYNYSLIVFDVVVGCLSYLNKMDVDKYKLDEQDTQVKIDVCCFP